MPADVSTCPRCGGAFHCGAHDPTPCACIKVELDAARLAALRDEFRGCLCLACLVELSAPAGATPATNAAAHEPPH